MLLVFHITEVPLFLGSHKDANLFIKWADIIEEGCVLDI